MLKAKKKTLLSGLTILLLCLDARAAKADELLDRPDVKECFSKVWELSVYGFMKWEAAAWIFKSIPDNGTMHCMLWPMTGKAGEISSSGGAPGNPQAIVHTHPYDKSAEPSTNDQNVAEKCHIPNYVISRAGIWKYDPAIGENIQVRDGIFVNQVLAKQKDQRRSKLKH